ncbi:MAG: hypothetical protein HN416_14935 [Nitrospina sp.]|jgi:hypothetical protein|nr:hypothetical protein [Nitrospina sp.]
MTDQIPDKWWEKHEDTILSTARARADRIFAGVAQELGYPTPVSEEDVARMMKELEPKFNMSADKLVDTAIDTAWSETIFEVFKEKYGHLCNRDEAGEILIPVHCIPEMHGLSDEEIDSKVQTVLKEHPGAAYLIPDPKTETIN